MATIDDFTKLDIRVGTVVEAEPFPEARVPAIKMKIDFGPLGIKRTSAQITNRYDADRVVGNQVVAVVNFRPDALPAMNLRCLCSAAYRSRGRGASEAGFRSAEWNAHRVSLFHLSIQASDLW